MRISRRQEEEGREGRTRSQHLRRQQPVPKDWQESLFCKTRNSQYGLDLQVKGSFERAALLATRHRRKAVKQVRILR